MSGSIQRYELIRPILLGSKTVEEVAQEADVSSRTLYRYLSQFRAGEGKVESLADKRRGPNSNPQRLTDEEKALVIRYKLKYPHLSTRQLAAELAEQGIVSISYRTVANLLSQGNFSAHFFF